MLSKDLDTAVERLLATDGLRRFANGLKTDQEKADFKRHLRRYAQIYMPDCPFEVNATNRYTIVTFEASLTARRPIRRNESIKYLCGIQVNITPEEEKEMAVRKKDFSLVVSSRKKCTSLFMGPARFANHDCNANAKLMTTSNAGIEIIAVRAIEPKEEITVTYGDNYFGEDNCECLCRTCEQRLVNGWAPEDGQQAVQPSIEDSEKSESYSLRHRRRAESTGGSSRTSSVNPEIRPRIRKLARRSSRMDLAATSSVAGSPTPESTPRGRKRTIDAFATPPVTPAKKLKHLLEPTDVPVSRGSSVSDSLNSSTDEAAQTDITSPESETPDPLMDLSGPKAIAGVSDVNADRNIIRIASVLSEKSLDVDAVDEQPRQEKPTKLVDLKGMSIAAILNAPAAEPQLVAPVAISIETAEDTMTENSNDAGPRKRKKYERRTFIKQPTPPARMRTAGDYILTDLLRSDRGTAWIKCTNCDALFVQQNAYYTRASCQRCERHSKLYGFVWPKTERAGPKDKEERILDHRTVHRFLHREDEKRARGWKCATPDDRATEEAETQTKKAAPVKKGPLRGRLAFATTKAKTLNKIVDSDDDTSGLRRSGRARRVSSRVCEA